VLSFAQKTIRTRGGRESAQAKSEGGERYQRGKAGSDCAGALKGVALPANEKGPSGKASESPTGKDPRKHRQEEGKRAYRWPPSAKRGLRLNRDRELPEKENGLLQGGGWKNAASGAKAARSVAASCGAQGPRFRRKSSLRSRTRKPKRGGESLAHTTQKMYRKKQGVRKRKEPETCGAYTMSHQRKGTFLAGEVTRGLQGGKRPQKRLKRRHPRLSRKKRTFPSSSDKRHGRTEKRKSPREKKPRKKELGGA